MLEFAFLSLIHSVYRLPFSCLVQYILLNYMLPRAKIVFAGTFLPLEGNKGECHLKVDSILFVLLETLHTADLIKALKIRKNSTSTFSGTIKINVHGYNENKNFNSIIPEFVFP